MTMTTATTTTLSEGCEKALAETSDVGARAEAVNLTSDLKSDTSLDLEKQDYCEEDGRSQGEHVRVSKNASDGTFAMRVETTNENEHYKELKKTVSANLDAGIVTWTDALDPENPTNFPNGKKWMAVGVFSACTFITPLGKASSMFAPAVEDVLREFGETSATIGSLTVSVFIVGYAVGPLFLSPLSELYGRAPVQHISNVVFTAFQLACARAHGTNELIVYRFLAGIGGSGPLALGGGVIADVFPPETRGIAVAIYSLGPLIGPVIGPICGGFVAEYAGWRWIFYILLILGAITTILSFLFLQETNASVILQRRTVKLRKDLQRSDLKSAYDSGLSSSETIKQALIRPLKLLFTSPIVLLMSSYMAFIYGLLYLLFTTISQVFVEQYHFSTGTSGLSYLGIGIGFLIGLGVCGKLSDPLLARMTKSNGGVMKPEFRLPFMLIGSLLLPIGLFWYGWSVEKHNPWIVPIIGLAPFGIGMMCCFLPINTYLIDAFTRYAASAIAASTVLRSLLGAFLPLAGPRLYASLGIGGGNSLLGGLAIAFIPIPLLFYKYGEKIRLRYPVKL